MSHDRLSAIVGGSGLTDSCVRERKNKTLVLGLLRFLLVILRGWAFVIWFRTRGRFLFVEQSSDAGAPPSLSQLSSALALLFGRFGCLSGMIAICIESPCSTSPNEAERLDSLASLLAVRRKLERCQSSTYPANAQTAFQPLRVTKTFPRARLVMPLLKTHMFDYWHAGP